MAANRVIDRVEEMATALSGLLKGAGGVTANAIANVDYVPPAGVGSALTVQTTGASTSGTLAARYGNRVDCKHDFGAVGDGVADDTAALLAARTAAGVGGTVYLPRGTYLTTLEIRPLDGQTIYGEGWGLTKVKALTNEGIQAVIQCKQVTGVRVEGLHLDGSNLTWHGSFGFDEATDCWVVGCKLEDGARGAFVVESLRSVILNCWIVNALEAHGIELSGSIATRIQGCTIATGPNPIANGIEIFATHVGVPIRGTQIIGCDITSQFAAGIKPLSDEGTVIAGCYIHHCPNGPAISAERGEIDVTVPSRNGTISGNVIASCGTGNNAPGILLDVNCHGWAISGNAVIDGGGPGIRLNQGSHHNATGNVVARNLIGGFSVVAGSDHQIVGNTVVDNGNGTGQFGIHLNAPSRVVLAANRAGNRDTTNQYHGMFLVDTVDCRVLGNNVNNNANANIAVSGTSVGLVLRDNVGFADSSTGTLDTYAKISTALGGNATFSASVFPNSGTATKTGASRFVSTGLTPAPLGDGDFVVEAGGIKQIAGEFAGNDASFVGMLLAARAAGSKPFFQTYNVADNTRWTLAHENGSLFAVRAGAGLGPIVASFSSSGQFTAAGALSVGGGTAVSRILSASATLDFPDTATGTSSELTVSVTGAAVGDPVFLATPAAPDANACFTARVSAADTVTVRLNNYSSGSIDPASGSYRVAVVKF